MESGQYENIIDSENLFQELQNNIIESIYNNDITEKELNKLNDIIDTDIEYSIKE